MMRERRNLNIKMIVFDKDGTLGDCTPSMHKWCDHMTKCIIDDYKDNRSVTLDNDEYEDALQKAINMFHAAIGWDNINGQLLPSAPLSAASWNDILKLSSDALIQSNCIVKAVEKVKRWHESCGDVHANDKMLIPDLSGFMKSLKDAGLLVAICTSDDRKATNQCIRHWGLENYIDFSICGDEVVESKPSPYPLITLCKQANVKPEECVVVGDTSADTGMGCNSNAALIVGVLTGSGTTEQLLATGAHIVLPDISFLKQYILPFHSLNHDCDRLDIVENTAVVSNVKA